MLQKVTQFFSCVLLGKEESHLQSWRVEPEVCSTREFESPFEEQKAEIKPNCLSSLNTWVDHEDQMTGILDMNEKWYEKPL